MYFSLSLYKVLFEKGSLYLLSSVCFLPFCIDSSPIRSSPVSPTTTDQSSQISKDIHVSKSNSYASIIHDLTCQQHLLSRSFLLFWKANFIFLLGYFTLLSFFSTPHFIGSFKLVFLVFFFFFSPYVLYLLNFMS